ncbi:MAG: right-handed parallel beta-helix repeat-containing protein, partial [Anaerolineae bacterium]
MAWSTDTWQARQKRNVTGLAFIALPVTLILALGLMATVVWMVGFPTSREVQAMPAAGSPIEQDRLNTNVICVATTGEDNEDCGTANTPCRTVQYAVDKAQAGGEIRIAAGTYNEIDSRESLTQVVYLTKSLTIRGGYTTSDWTTPDPEANPTTLDAQGQGRVMVISPTITVHLEGLRFVGGNATGLGGGLSAALTSEPTITDAGGGLYVLTATVTVSNSLIFSNTGSITGTAPGSDVGGGLGGGIYVRDGSVELRYNTIVSNTAGVNVPGYGGGIYLDRSSATLLHNVITSNTGTLRDDGYGGGLYLYGGVPPEPLPIASLVDNTLQGNYASRTGDGQGGGLYANHYHVELTDNLVQFNTGGTAKEGKGGGLYIFFSEALLERNLVRYNVASRGEEGISGGVHFCTCPDVTLKTNT